MPVRSGLRSPAQAPVGTLSAAESLRSDLPTQASTLLPSLFRNLDTQQRVTVFHVGPALAETVAFFCDYRCRLHFVDVFAELPVVPDEDAPAALMEQFTALLRLPEGTTIDVCLFWDIFNYLSADAILAFQAVLLPHLKSGCLAHAFSMHNRNLPQVSHLYGIRGMESLSVRRRSAAPLGYAPHSQRELTTLLHGFRLERSVLLPDSRLELLLQARH